MPQPWLSKPCRRAGLLAGLLTLGLLVGSVSAGNYTVFTLPGAGGGGAGGAPTNAQYWTGAANGDLSAEKNLGGLSTGLVINTAGTPTAYGGAACTNQVIEDLNASGAPTCVSITSAYVDSSIALSATTITIAGTANEITSSAGAQSLAANRTWTLSLPSTVDFTSKTLRIPNSVTLPATCTVGDAYMDTNATTGQRFYLCESTDTWALQGDGGGGGSGYATVEDEGTPVTQRTTLNFAGAGVSCADDTTKTTCTIAGGGTTPLVNGFRLSLVSGDSLYAINDACLTPSATDTTAETVDFAAAHAWPTGATLFSTAATGGLSLNTQYYVRAVDTDTVSFHTTAADALADTSKVNLTASVTQALCPAGIANSTVYLTPHTHGQIALYNGSSWDALTSGEVSLALSSLTSGKNYDVFAYNNSGTLTLELSTAWTDDNTRADAVTTQNGVCVKTGATTRRCVGVIRTTGTTTTEDSSVKRFVANFENLESRVLWKEEWSSTWTTASTTWQQMNGSTANAVEVVVPRRGTPIVVDARILTQNNTALAACPTGIGVNSTTVLAPRAATTYASRITADNIVMPSVSFMQAALPLGYHKVNWLQVATAGTCSFLATNITARRSAISGEIRN